MRTIHHTTCPVIPPHILRHVAAHGDGDARKNVAATLRQTAQIERERAHSLDGTQSAHSAVSAVLTKRREVYDANHRRTLPGKLVMADRKAASTDIEAIEAYDGSGAVWDFFSKVFLRNSIDGRGMPLVSTIHYGLQFDNALWDGKQMIYGDGDGTLFNRFTIAIDVIGHELTHGVTQYTAALKYEGQSGALNEHISDAFGIMVKQYVLGELASQSDWLIGAGLLATRIRGKAIRSMKAPGTAYDDPAIGRDPQPAHMRDYVEGTDDNGGVHINSGILNHAFYLAATELGGEVWMIVGLIWYRVLTVMLFPGADFQDFANATVIAAGELYGIGGAVQMIIADAWARVGLPVPAALTRPRLRPLFRAQRRTRPALQPRV